jgi:hypothetical protein
MYNYASREVEWLCGPRETPDGRFLPGCDATVYHFPLSKEQFHSLISQPQIQESFFVMQVMGDENL